jgi:hypothetical protein
MTEVNQDPSPGKDISAAEKADLDLDRDIFMRTLMRELSGTLQDLVGIEEASGFISVVGKNVGKFLDAGYKKLWRWKIWTARRSGMFLSI